MTNQDFIHQDFDNQPKNEKITIEPGNKILFIGDSVTDVGRNRSDRTDLGQGYPLLLGSYLWNKYPAHDLEILNRGISGNSVADLKNRWEKDCLDLNPDIVSILIGVNNVWKHMEDDQTSDEEALMKFENDYRWLLKTLAHRTDARVVIMEPFVLPYPKDRQEWREHIDPRIHIVRRLAKDYHATFVPLDGILNAKGIAHDFQTYTGDDGIHPTVAGHAAIAEAWIQYVDI